MVDMNSVPSAVPLLRILNRVLLPTTFARVTIDAGVKKSIAIVDHLHGLGKHPRDFFIAVVPETEQDKLKVTQAGVIIATAARVLQLSKNLQSGEWVMVLEGLCRLSVGSTVMHPSSVPTGLPFELAQVTQLESGSLGTSKAGEQAPTHVLSTADSASIQQLGIRLKASTRTLLRILSRRAGLTNSGRILELMDALPAWRAADMVAAAVSSSHEERLAVLHAVDPKQRLKLALQLVQQALSMARQVSVHGKPSGSQGTGRKPGSAWGAKNTVLHPALKQQQGLSSEDGVDGSASTLNNGGRDGSGSAGGEEDEEEDDLSTLLARLQAAAPPPEVLKAATKEYKRLLQMGENSPGFASARSYLEVLSELPWSKLSWQVAKERQQKALQATEERDGAEPSTSFSSDAWRGVHKTLLRQQQTEFLGTPLSLKEARALLDSQHHGLDKVKDRVVEHMAVMRLKGGSAKAPILCFIGPPGVGKTSLARSVAEVLGRPLVRIAMGGVRDEAEVRGHRRTYVGAMPGRIIQGLRHVGVADPVMLLDEVDKLGRDTVRGDPAAALLEVLDPEQNHGFTDTYLSLPFDLSRVAFVATANRAADIPSPLLDRMEVIQLSGYTLEEKVHIAQKHLVPKLLSEHGLGSGNLKITDDVMSHVIDRYTREAGVRNLSRALSAICRHVAVSIVSADDEGRHQLHAVGQPDVMSESNSFECHGDTVTASRLQSNEAWKPFLSSADSNSGCLQSDTQSDMSPEFAQLLGKSFPNSSQPLKQKMQPALLPGNDGKVLSDPLACLVSRASVYGSGDPAVPTANTSVTSMSSNTADISSHMSKASSSAKAHEPSRSQEASGTQDSEAPMQHSNGLAWLFSKFHTPSVSFPITSSMRSHTPPPSSPPNDASAAVLEPHLTHHPLSLHSPIWPSQHTAITPGAIVSLSKGRDKSAGERSANLHLSDSSEQGLPYPPDLLEGSALQHVSIAVSVGLVEAVLGPPKYSGVEAVERIRAPGTAAGLVWTAAGGSVQYVECARIGYGSVDRPGTLTLTGQVGEVLEESSRIALSWIRSHAYELGFEESHEKSSIHSKAASFNNRSSLPAAVDVQDHPLNLRPDYLNPDSDTANGCDLQPSGIIEVQKSSMPLIGSRPSSSIIGYHGTFPLQAFSPPHLNWGSQEAPKNEAGDTKAPQKIPAIAQHASRMCQSSENSPVMNWDIHIHLPAGAIPKDGPSAGITLAVVMTSLLSGRCVRADTAMTGELTLRGLVLPIGGVKEKLLAARHAGIKRVIVPARNMREVAFEVPLAVKEALEIIPVERLEEVLYAAFEPPFLLLPVSKM